MVKLIASDLDGTIIDKENKIYKENFKAIKEINKSNIPFVICTGKTYSIYKNLCSSFDASYGIFGNGSSIVDLKSGKTIYQNLLEISDVVKFLMLAKDNNLHVHLYTPTQVLTEELLYLDLRNYKLQKKHIYNNELEFKIVPDLLKYVSSNKIDVLKVVVSGEKDLKKIEKDILNIANVDVLNIKKYGKYKDKIINKEYEYLDIVPKNVNKDTALQILCKYLNIEEENVLAIGDNLNDLGMIRKAGIGVAVSNAYSELKEIADYTTKAPVQKGGFAEAVYKFINF